jgi:AbrB family looped-hinge helix DNA binding protein
MADLYQHAADPEALPRKSQEAIEDRRFWRFRGGRLTRRTPGITRSKFGITVSNVSKMTAKGQVTIPKRLRDHLGVGPGSEIEFYLASDGRVCLTAPDGPCESRFVVLRGSVGPGMTTDELMSLTRGEPDD